MTGGTENLFFLRFGGIRARRCALRGLFLMFDSNSWLWWILVEILMNIVFLRRVTNHRLRLVKNLNGREFINRSGGS